jgi:DNA polymerase-3 subunit delta
MNPQEFDACLKKGTIPPLVCLCGEETFLVDRATRQLLERAIDPALRDFNFNLFYGDETNGVDILDAAQTLPMFSSRRAVLVKRTEQLKAQALELLSTYIQQPAPATCLILSGAKIDQRKKFFSEFKKHGVFVEYKRLFDNKLSGFVTREAASCGISIEPAAAELLTFLVGNNLRDLASQIEKLVVFCGTRTRITIDDVRAIASNSKEFTVFEFARFLGNRDIRNAIISLDTLFRNGEETFQLLGALARHFRQLWRIREMLDRRAPQTEIGHEVGISPFFLGEMVRQAKNFRRDELREIFEELYRCDIGSKTGGRAPDLIYGLALGICGGEFRHS